MEQHTSIKQYKLWKLGMLKLDLGSTLNETNSINETKIAIEAIRLNTE